MAVCERYRVPHSVFLAWSQDDRDKALWWRLRQASACSGCGTRAQEWRDADGGPRDAYRAEAIRCRGCELIEQARKAVPENAGGGIHVELRPVTGE